jgi:hypothetical protein
MGYRRRIWILQGILLAVVARFCIGIAAIAGLPNILRMLIPFLVFIGTGAFCVWLDHKLPGHFERFVIVRTGVAIGVSLTSAVFVGMLLDPRRTNFTWQYILFVSTLVGVVSSIIVPIAGYSNLKMRELLWGKRSRNYTKPK